METTHKHVVVFVALPSNSLDYVPGVMMVVMMMMMTTRMTTMMMISE